MAKILYINASLGGNGSHSQRLAHEFLELWQHDFPQDQVITRDLVADPPPFINSAFTAALYKQASDYSREEAEIMHVSDAYVDEVLQADYLVLAAPVYNYTLPTLLKAYIDLILRIGRTFVSTPDGSQGLLGGRKVLVFSARLGDYSPGSGREHFDYHEPYLRFVFERMGISDVQYIAVSQNPMIHDESTRSAQMDTYRGQMEQVLKGWREARTLSLV
jgi:FMN-dependent NADH-azoreductase